MTRIDRYKAKTRVEILKEETGFNEILIDTYIVMFFEPRDEDQRFDAFQMLKKLISKRDALVRLLEKEQGNASH